MKRKVGTFLCEVLLDNPYVDLRELRNLERLSLRIVLFAKVNGVRYISKQENIVHLLAKHRHDDLVFNYKQKKNWTRVDVTVGPKIITIYVNETGLLTIKKYEK